MPLFQLVAVVHAVAVGKVGMSSMRYQGAAVELVSKLLRASALWVVVGSRALYVPGRLFVFADCWHLVSASATPPAFTVQNRVNVRRTFPDGAGGTTTA